MIRRLVPAVILALALASIATMELVRTWASGLVWSPLERKLALADRVAYYQATTALGPRFTLSGGERELSLITHLRLPDAAQYDPERDYSYGVRLVLWTPAGDRLWDREVYTSSRQSKAGFFDGIWTHENAFSLVSGVQITDDRDLRVTLPEQFPRGSELEINLLGDPEAVGLVRVYERSERADAQRHLLHVSLSPDRQSRLVSHLTYLPWESLTAVQKWARVRFQWNRLSAAGEAGQNYKLETVYTTGYRSVQTIAERDRAVQVSPNRPVALNVLGPVELEVRAASDAVVPTATTLTVRHVDQTGADETWELAVPPAGSVSRRVQIPDGVHSLLLSTSARYGVSARLVGWAERPIGFAAERLEPIATGEQDLRPDLRRIPLYRLGAGLPAVVAALGGPDDVFSRVVRIDARAFVVTVDDAPAELQYEFLAASGESLARGPWPLTLEPPTSSFEAVTLAELPEPRPVSEPESVRLIAPAGAATLRLSSTAPVAIALYTLWPLEQSAIAVAPPYADVVLDGVRWRYAPLEHRSWHPMRAENHLELDHSGATFELGAHVRLEPLPDPQQLASGSKPGSASTPWVSVAPSRSRESQAVLERLGGPGAPGREPQLGRYTELRPGKRLRLRNPDSGTVRVIYRGDPASLGQSVTFDVSGETYVRAMTTTRGEWTLPTPDGGALSLDASTDALDLRMWVSELPSARSRVKPAVYAQRTVHRIGKRPARIIVRREDGPVTLNAVVYAVGSGHRLRIRVDGGHPDRREGVLLERVTIATREVELRESARSTELVFLNRSESEPEYSIFKIPITLGEDLPEGRHVIDIEVLDGADVWTRFFRAGKQRGATTARQWVEQHTDVEEAVDE